MVIWGVCVGGVENRICAKRGDLGGLCYKGVEVDGKYFFWGEGEDLR